MDPSHAPQPMDLLALCETLKSNADDAAGQIIQQWREIGGAEPWHSLPDDLEFNHLPDLIRALAGAALCTEYDPGLCRKVVAVSAEHGEHRAEEGLDQSLLYREYHLLRRSLWKQMKGHHGENSTVYYATMRLDALTSLAVESALLGLNREALEANGRWPDVLTELLDSWPLPGT